MRYPAASGADARGAVEHLGDQPADDPEYDDPEYDGTRDHRATATTRRHPGDHR